MSRSELDLYSPGPPEGPLSRRAAIGANEQKPLTGVCKRADGPVVAVSLKAWKDLLVPYTTDVREFVVVHTF